jgi:hypothetical protein
LQFRSSYDSIEAKCQEVKKRMMVRIKDADKIDACLRKKEYFSKLRSRTLEYLHPEGDSGLVRETKLQLSKFLHAFG